MYHASFAYLIERSLVKKKAQSYSIVTFPRSFVEGEVPILDPIMLCPEIELLILGQAERCFWIGK